MVDPLTPKLTEAGDAATVVFNAENAFSLPPPAFCTGAVRPESKTNGVALSISNERYWRAVRPGRALFSRAATPATAGDEKLVPASTTNPPCDTGRADDRLLPTDTISGLIPPSLLGPLLE